MDMKPIRLALAATVTAALMVAPSASSASRSEASNTSSQACLWKHSTKSVKTRTFNTYPRIEMRRKVVRTVTMCGDERVVTKRRTPWKPVKRDGHPAR